MNLTIHNEPVPLSADEHGVFRVGDSRVPVDVVIRAYLEGTDPEQLVRAYDTLVLADVHAVIAYYLRHREEIDQYLQARRDEADRLRDEIEAAQPDRVDLRAKLLNRKAQLEQGHASPGK